MCVCGHRTTSDVKPCFPPCLRGSLCCVPLQAQDSWPRACRTLLALPTPSAWTADAALHTWLFCGFKRLQLRSSCLGFLPALTFPHVRSPSSVGLVWKRWHLQASPSCLLLAFPWPWIRYVGQPFYVSVSRLFSFIILSAHNVLPPTPALLLNLHLWASNMQITPFQIYRQSFNLHLSRNMMPKALCWTCFEKFRLLAIQLSYWLLCIVF